MQIMQLRHEANPDGADYKLEGIPFCSIGSYSYAYPKVIWWPETPNRLYIGKFCSVAAECEFLLGGEHDLSRITTYPFPHIPHFETDAIARKETYVPESGSIRVGNDVWIGNGATILSGVTIGDGVVIGAGAMVAKDVAPYQVVVGNPAQVLRSRFDEGETEILLRVRWWDWPVEKIRKNIELIMSRDVASLLAVDQDG